MAKLHCEIKAMVDFFDTPLPERIHNVIFISESFSYIVRLYFESDFYTLASEKCYTIFSYCGTDCHVFT
jgi:hypothetical protein